MKRLLRTALCLALGAASLPASAQELNFRAVAPPRPAAVSAEIPITLSQPMPTEGRSIARAKVQDDGYVVFTATEPSHVPVSYSVAQPTRFAQKDMPQRMPQPPGEFIAPPPKIIADPPLAGNVVNHQPVPGGVVVGNGPAPYSVLNGAVVDGGCCGDTCGASGCGSSCCGNDCNWERQHPFDCIYDIFSNCCTGCCCAPRTPLWVRGEFLLYGVSRQQLPGLVTQAPTAGQLATDATLLYGNTGVPSTFLNGGRISAGFWFPRCCDWGIDGSYFFLGQRTDSFFASSTGAAGVPALGRPYIDNNPNEIVNNGFANVVIANPNVGLGVAQSVAGNGTPGSISVLSSTEASGFDVNLRRKLCCGPNVWFDGVIGYRYFNLQDGVTITEDIGLRTNLNGNNVLNPGSADRTIVTDSFATRNIFNGVQVGIEGEWRFCPRWTLGGTFKFAAGNVEQRIAIDGSTTLFNANFPAVNNTFARQTQSGGLLAQGTNIGSYSANRFAVLPELGIRLGWDITPHWRVFAGYNVMYLSNVVRAGEQIDTRVNSSQFAFNGTQPATPPATGPVFNGAPGVLVGPATPSVLFRTSEFWAQGVSFGLEYRY